MAVRRFKVKPSNDSHYFWCFVFDSKPEMYKWYLKEAEAAKTQFVNILTGKPSQYDLSLQFEGMCLPFELFRVLEDGTEEKGDNIGNVIFHRSRLGAGLVAHEMGHCAMWYERIVNGNPGAVFGPECGNVEERFLYILHDLVKMFYQKAYKMKLI